MDTDTVMVDTDTVMVDTVMVDTDTVMADTVMADTMSHTVMVSEDDDEGAALMSPVLQRVVVPSSCR